MERHRTVWKDKSSYRLIYSIHEVKYRIIYGSSVAIYKCKWMALHKEGHSVYGGENETN